MECPNQEHDAYEDSQEDEGQGFAPEDLVNFEILNSKS